MNRRKFLKISAAGAALIGGSAVYTMLKESDPLSPFHDATQKVFNEQFGDDLSAKLMAETKNAYAADKFSRYMCLSDFVISKAFNRGLVRFETLAEGGKRCDFRYKKGRETFVFPLREGWPPRFIDSDTGAS